jgi:hypothetical protein
MKLAFLVLINKINMKISQVGFESNVVNKLVRNRMKLNFYKNVVPLR